MSDQKIYISESEEPTVTSGKTVEVARPVRKKTSTKTKANDKEALSYEASVARLEEIVRRLEQSREGIGLEESMGLYEEGVSLVRRCYRELEAAEQRVKILQETPDGEIRAINFETDSE